MVSVPAKENCSIQFFNELEKAVKKHISIFNMVVSQDFSSPYSLQLFNDISDGRSANKFRQSLIHQLAD
jgi:hypothetical protein